MLPYGLVTPHNSVTGIQIFSSAFITCAPVVASSGFLSSLIRRNRGKRREIPLSGSTWWTEGLFHVEAILVTQKGHIVDDLLCKDETVNLGFSLAK